MVKTKIFKKSKLKNWLLLCSPLVLLLLADCTCAHPLTPFVDTSIEVNPHNIVVSENRIRTSIHVELPVKSIQPRMEAILQIYLDTTLVKTDTIKSNKRYNTERPIRDIKLNLPDSGILVNPYSYINFNIKLRHTRNGNYLESEKVQIAMVFTDSSAFLKAKETNRIWK